MERYRVGIGCKLRVHLGVFARQFGRGKRLAFGGGPPRERVTRFYGQRHVAYLLARFTREFGHRFFAVVKR